MAGQKDRNTGFLTNAMKFSEKHSYTLSLKAALRQREGQIMIRRISRRAVIAGAGAVAMTIPTVAQRPREFPATKEVPRSFSTMTRLNSMRPMINTFISPISIRLRNVLRR